MLSLEQIKDLIDHVVDRGVAVVEVERSGFRLRIEGPKVAPAADVAAPNPTIVDSGAEPEDPRPSPAEPGVVMATSESNADSTVAEASGESDAPRLDVPADAHLLASPIVGTFYAAPSPDSPPFVQVGETVHKGQVVCIVEAMKLMNEVECDVDGVVVATLVDNGQPVEFGQPLLAIRTDDSA